MSKIKIRHRLLALGGLFLFVSTLIRADNPIVIGKGLTDPHGVVYGDRLFLYSTHDFSQQNQNFVMKDWWVWSSDDFVNWTQEGTLKPDDTFIGHPFDDCWGSFGISKNGKYYWYFSAGPEQIGVVESDTPRGPWKDPLGKPLIPKGLVSTQERDPQAMIDDDGKAYLVFGTFDYFIVRLGDDMISLAETPHPVVLDRKFGPYGEGKTDDKPSIHKRNGIYYLSWCSFYATSNNVYGPYTYKGSVIDPEKVGPEFRNVSNIFHDRHGNFFQFHHQWYYACNDKSWPGTSDYFRDIVLSYVHYKDNGDMAPVVIDRLGVGQYDATQPKIEAENYFNAEGVTQSECPEGGFELRNIHNGSFVDYPNVLNLPANATLTLRLSAHGTLGGIIEVHGQSITGPLLGKCTYPDTSSWATYQTVSTKLQNQSGKQDLYLVFRGGPGELVRLNWLSFGKSN